MGKDVEYNVVLINTGRVVNAKGGAEKVLCDMANALCVFGYSVTIICLDFKEDGLPGFPLSESVRFINAGRGGRPIYCRGVLKSIRSFAFERSRRRAKREEIDNRLKSSLLGKVLRSIGVVDVFITFQPKDSYLISTLDCVRAPIVTMFHMDPKYFFSGPEMEVTREAVKVSSLVTVLLPSYIHDIKRVCASTCVVAIPNAIKCFEKPALLNNRKIVCIGRLTRQKRIELLIEAFAEINNAIPEWKIEHWGENNLDFEYANEIKQLVKELGIEDKICFCGPTDNVEKVLGDASIFAFPSAFEGFPLALGEAMAKGVPAVGCKDCSGTNEIITDRVNGLLTEPNYKDFSIALKSLAENRSFRMALGMKARSDIQKYSPDNIWPLWDGLIRKLADK